LMQMCWKKQPQQRPVSFLCCFCFCVFVFSFHTNIPTQWFDLFHSWLKCWYDFEAICKFLEQ
jgi:hypothetical protein